ncbi:MAG: general secretion pathway protein M [Alteromonadaceae bacterium]|jgi:general secretion pathway protein M
MLKNWWESLNEREHKLVMGGGSVVAVGIFFFAIWQPLANTVTDNQASLIKQQNLNVWATDTIAKIKATSASKVSSGGSLSQVVNQSSRRFNIQVTRMNPKDDELQLWLDNIVFNDLLKWLAHLEASEGISIVGIDVNEGTEPGIVNVRRLVITK